MKPSHDCWEQSVISLNEIRSCVILKIAINVTIPTLFVAISNYITYWCDTLTAATLKSKPINIKNRSSILGSRAWTSSTVSSLWHSGLSNFQDGRNISKILLSLFLTKRKLIIDTRLSIVSWVCHLSEICQWSKTKKIVSWW